MVCSQFFKFQFFKSSLHGAGLALLLGSLLACRASKQPPETIDALAHRYVVLANELGEHDPDSLDFSFAFGPDTEQLRNQQRTLDSLHRGALALRDQLKQLAEDSPVNSQRKSFLIGQVNAIVLRTEQLLGKDRSFDEESQTFFGIIAPADQDASRRSAIRKQLAVLLGKGMDPADAYARYDSHFIVPADRVPEVMRNALQQCRTLTLQHMTLPAGERVAVQYVVHKPWSAFSRYLGNAHSLIQVNMDYPLTVDRILELACHEGYPGHHVFNSLRDQSLVTGQHREEFRVQLTFSPQSYISEAAASYAPHLVLSEAERLHIELDILFPLAGLKRPNAERYLRVQKLIAALHTAVPSIAREYLDGRLEFVRAANALQQETLMLHGETTLLYLNEYRTYVLCYTIGNDSVSSWLEGGHSNNAARWERYLILMSSPVTSLQDPAH